MTFTAMSLSMWGTLFAGIGAVVALLYMLKLRRRRIEVPFGPLWQQVLAEKQTSSLFRVLKRYFSLLLQLAFIALLLTAIADPIWTGSPLIEHREQVEEDPYHTLLVVDTSASMGATDVEGGRMAAALDKADAIVDAMRTGESMMIARMDRDVTAITDWTMDRDALHDVITALRPLDTGTSVEPVMQFARNAVRGLTNAQVVVVTDRAFSPPDKDLARSIKLRVAPVGDTSTDNLAVLDFNVRSHLGNALQYALYYRIHNASKKTVAATAYLYSDPAGTARTRQDFLKLAPVGEPMGLTLKPGETKVVEKIALTLQGSRAALFVAPTNPAEFTDVMPADDAAFAVVPTRKEVKVQLVGAPNLFLQAALSTRSHVDVVQTPLADFKSSEGYDLTVFDGVAPEKPGKGNQIYINAATGGLPYKVRKGDVKGGKLKVPSARRKHALMKFVKFVDLDVGRILRLRKGRGDVVMARGKGGKPAILAHSSETGRWVAVAFDPVATEWVGHYSFSIFFVNAINWFFAEEVKLLRPWSLARRWDVRVPWKGISKVDLLTPSGEKIMALVDGGGTLAYTGVREGIYEVRHPSPNSAAQQTPIVVAAALKSVDESQLEARGDYDEWKAPPPKVEAAPDIKILGASLWQLLVLLALALMTIEWLTYHRRWTV